MKCIFTHTAQTTAPTDPPKHPPSTHTQPQQHTTHSAGHKQSHDDIPLKQSSSHVHARNPIFRILSLYALALRLSLRPLLHKHIPHLSSARSSCLHQQQHVRTRSTAKTSNSSYKHSLPVAFPLVVVATHIFTCKQVVLDRFVGGRRPRRPHSPMWHHKSSIRIKATHFLRFCRPPRPPSVRPPLYMPSTNCISPCMIRDDSDEKPNSDGSTLPPFLAPPFFFPAAWKPSSSCCFAPFLPPALFVQEGMGWGKRERGQMCVVGSESCKQHGCASKAGG